VKTVARVCCMCGIDFLESSLDVYFNGELLPREPATCSDDCKSKRMVQNWERIFERLFPSESVR